MKIMLVCDIFGLNSSSDKMKLYIENLGHEVFVLDPYSKVYNNFKTEKEAYFHFIKNALIISILIC